METRKVVFLLILVAVASSLITVLIMNNQPETPIPPANGDEGIPAEYTLYPLGEAKTFEGITIQYRGYDRVEYYRRIIIRRHWNSSHYVDATYSTNTMGSFTIRVDYLELEVEVANNERLTFVIKGIHK